MRTMNRILAAVIAIAVAIPVIFFALNVDKLFEEKIEVSDYTLGMGTVVALDGSTQGAAKQTATIAAVILDDSGKVVKCVIDVADTKLDVTDGNVTTGNTYLTKNELGNDYGMKTYSGIGKEWFEQADAFADFCVGKTADQIEKIEVGDNGKATDADLLSGCTMGVSDIKAAVIKAVNDKSAKKYSSAETADLSLAVIVDDSASAPATAEAEGKASMTVNLCAAAVVDSKVAGAVIDIAQPSFAFNTAGEITKTDFSKTKRELGDDYGMKTYSGVGKEWYEQADVFCDHIVGMSASDISSIGIGDGGKATDADLLSGCTIAVGDFVKIASKAIGMADKTYTLGLGMVVDTTSSAKGSAAQTATIAAVILDSEGKVVKCVIDVCDTKLDITDGKVTTGNTYLTKNELGDDYGMKTYSAIGKEWYEQAKAYAEFCIGKTADEIEKIEVADSGKATDADLLAGCTMGVSAIKEAVVKAVKDEQAKSFTASAEPALSLATIADDTSSKAAEEGKDGSAAINFTVCAMAVADGKTQGAIIDVAQSSVGFDATGEITKKDAVKTKRELGDDYGMKTYSGVGKEWYEQADAFCDHLVGMDESAVSAIAMGDGGKATDADLLSGCTVAIGDFVKIAAKAIKMAE